MKQKSENVLTPQETNPYLQGFKQGYEKGVRDGRSAIKREFLKILQEINKKLRYIG